MSTFSLHFYGPIRHVLPLVVGQFDYHRVHLARLVTAFVFMTKMKTQSIFFARCTLKYTLRGEFTWQSIQKYTETWQRRRKLAAEAFLNF